MDAGHAARARGIEPCRWQKPIPPVKRTMPQEKNNPQKRESCRRQKPFPPEKKTLPQVKTDSPRTEV